MASVRAPLLETPVTADFSTKDADRRLCPKLIRYTNNYWNELKAHTLSLPSILLLIYSVTVPICSIVAYNFANDITVLPQDHLCIHHYSESEATAKSAVFIVQNILYLFIPLAGWVADTKIGRGMAIYIGLWLGWFGTLLQSLSGCFQYSSCGTMALVGRYGLSSLALVCLIISVDLLYATVLVYGMDQLIIAPSIKVRAFISWYVWFFF